jgi:hypothetical protein
LIFKRLSHGWREDLQSPCVCRGVPMLTEIPCLFSLLFESHYLLGKRVNLFNWECRGTHLHHPSFSFIGWNIRRY